MMFYRYSFGRAPSPVWADRTGPHHDFHHNHGSQFDPVTNDLPSRGTSAMCPTDSLRYHLRAIATETFPCRGEHSTPTRYCNIAFLLLSLLNAGSTASVDNSRNGSYELPLSPPGHCRSETSHMQQLIEIPPAFRRAGLAINICASSGG